jgi:hypothetical protein
MSNVKLQRKVGKSLVEVFRIDAVISHEHNLTSTITEHPTEGGDVIAHNIRNDPREIVVTGFVSNFPVRLGLGVLPRRDNSRGQNAKEALEEIRDNKELVQITDELGVYENMGIGSLTFPRDSQTYHGLRFTATFRKMKIVGVQVVELSDEQQVQDVAAPAGNLGKQTPDDASDSAFDQASTFWNLVN